MPALGWRARSVYDTRATFISLAVEDGAEEAIVSRLTLASSAAARGER